MKSAVATPPAFVNPPPTSSFPAASAFKANTAPLSAGAVAVAPWPTCVHPSPSAATAAPATPVANATLSERSPIPRRDGRTTTNLRLRASLGEPFQRGAGHKGSRAQERQHAVAQERDAPCRRQALRCPELHALRAGFVQEACVGGDFLGSTGEGHQFGWRRAVDRRVEL